MARGKRLAPLRGNISFEQTLVERCGEAGRLIAAKNWSDTPIGPIEIWPQSLKSALALLLLSPIPIVMLWGEDGVMLYNDAYSVFAGDRHPQLLGSKVREGWPEVADFHDNVMKAGLAGGTLAYRDQEFTLYRHGHPEQVWMNLDYSPVLNETGQPAGVIGVIVEITEQVQAERRAATERERILQAFEQTPGFIMIVLGPEHRVEFVNAAHRKVFSSEAWVGKTILEAFPDIEGQDFFEILDDVFATGKRYVGDAAPVNFRQPDGHFETRYLNFVYEAMRDADGQIIGVLCEGSDVTAVHKANEILERRIAERTRELTEAHEALRQAQKMEAVGQLTGGIAHDFNNLLTGISGSLELLERGLARRGVGGLERYVHGAQSSARRAAALTQRLLAFSRRQTLDPKPTDINKLIYGLEDMIRRTVGPAVEVEVVGQVRLWTTRVDSAQLENALLNLVINARDAMPEGGRITIETGNNWLDDRGARERDLIPGQYLSICVTDTGTGISAEIVDRIFDPFFTTKPLGGGTGLGLSMVHGFVRQSGGEVRVHSEVGKGTTMCLYLPRYLGSVEAEAAQEPVLPESRSGETVLVIDDEPTVRMLMADVLSEAGYIVLEAQDGPSGMRILQSEARIDLLVTDVGLPGMNGRQVADAARVTRPGLKVLFVTGFAEKTVVGNDHLPSGMTVMTKPFVVSELASKVSEIIES
jgi:PAS domain S-box-containing protein